MTCDEHTPADPSCPACYPSAVGYAPPAQAALEGARAVTEPAPPAFLAPPSAREVLEHELTQRLHGLPLALSSPADYELARVTFERAVNWYFWSYSPRPAGLRVEPMRVLSDAHVRVISEDELEQVARIFEVPPSQIIPLRALLNFVRDVARVLGRDERAPALIEQLRELVQRAPQ